MKKNFYWVFMVALSAVAGPLLAGESPTQREVDNLRDALLENFAACNREDVKGVLDSHHSLTAKDKLEELRKEAEECFAETNIRVRLVSMTVHSYENPLTPGNVKIAQRANIPTSSAYADVVQLTLPSDHSYADLEEYPTELSSDYRHDSAMLPSHQLVSYTIRFGYDYRAKRWKVFRIVSKVTPVNQWPEDIREIMEGQLAPAMSRDGITSEPAPKSGGRKN
jgi:hypothetical protein